MRSQLNPNCFALWVKTVEALDLSQTVFSTFSDWRHERGLENKPLPREEWEQYLKYIRNYFGTFHAPPERMLELNGPGFRVPFVELRPPNRCHELDPENETVG